MSLLLQRADVNSSLAQLHQLRSQDHNHHHHQRPLWKAGLNWPRLPREVLDAPSLGTFKVRSDGALSNLIQLEMFLLTAGGLG